MPLTIEIKTIPHIHHRYNTLGDYFGHDRARFIAITEMGNPWAEFLVAYHELTEQALCLKRGISEEAITAFDIDFENKRLSGSVTGEPGDCRDAPYYREHQEATMAEKKMCNNLGMDWDAYCAFLENLDI